MPNLAITLHSHMKMIAFIQTDSKSTKISIFHTNENLAGSITLVENTLMCNRNSREITTFDQRIIASLTVLCLLGDTFDFGDVDSDLIEKVIENWKDKYKPSHSDKHNIDYEETYNPDNSKPLNVQHPIAPGKNEETYNPDNSKPLNVQQPIVPGKNEETYNPDNSKTLNVQQPRVPGKAEKNYNKSIGLLLQKISDMAGKPECKKAIIAAHQLHSALKSEGEKYFSGELSTARHKEFKQNCEGFIKTARLELDQHRGFNKILLNILAIVLTAGVGYAFAACIDIALNKGKFTFFSTDSSIKINSIEKHINEMAPSA